MRTTKTTTRGIVYQEDIVPILDGGCGNPDCPNPDCLNEVFLEPECHPSSGVHVAFERGSNFLRLTCATCDAQVGLIYVGNNPNHVTISE